MKNHLLLAAIPILGLCSSAELPAAPVTFYFTGVVEYFSDVANLAPGGIGLGSPYVGKITYDGSHLWSTYNTPESAFYYLITAEGFTMSIQIGGHTFLSVPANNGYQNGVVGVQDNPKTYDYWMADTESASILLDGQEFQAYPLISSIGIWLQDSTHTAMNSLQFPTSVPDLSKFDSRQMSLVTRRDDGGSDELIGVWGTVDSISLTEPVALTIAPAAKGFVKLSWPASAQGYTLQFARILDGGTWKPVTNSVSEVSGQKVVTVPASESPRFFRLSQ